MAKRVYGKSVASYSAWAALTEYVLTNYRVPTTDNGMRYECTTAGTSGETEPIWDAHLDSTTNDGTVVWTCREKEASPSALSVEIDTSRLGGAPKKDVWMKSDGSVTFVIEVSHNGNSGSWREMASVNVNNTEKFEQYTTPYNYVRVSTETVASNEIEIVAGE